MYAPTTIAPEKSADFFIDSIKQSFLNCRANKFDSNSCKHDACQLLNWYRFDYFRPRPTWWTRSKVILHIWIWIFWVKWSTFDKNRASNELHQFDQRFFCTMKRESCMKFRFCNTTLTMQGKYKWTNRETQEQLILTCNMLCMLLQGGGAHNGFNLCMHGV